MADIFISYANEDRSRVEPLAKALDEKGWSVQSGFEIFLSWSREDSLQVAKILKSWIPLTIEGPRLWLSSQDSPEGARWSPELAIRLDECNFGILVITPTNIQSPWLMFEAGALSKNFEEGKVIPYLIAFSDLPGEVFTQHPLNISTVP